MPHRVSAALSRPRQSVELARMPFGPRATVHTIVKPGAHIKEPSAITYDATRGTLFVAGDRGDLAEIKPDGQVLQRRNIGGRNFEAVTVGPGGRLYAVEEGKPPTLCEIDPESLKIVARAKIDTRENGARILGQASNKSVEGICYVPAQNAFFVVNQDPARLVRLEVSREGAKLETKISKVVDLSRVVKRQASDLMFDSRSGHFLVLESGSGERPNLLHEITMQGGLLRTVRVPGDRPEGLALAPGGQAFLAQDSGGVLRIDP